MGALHVDPGRLDVRLRLEAADEGPDGQGGQAEGWTEVATLWARQSATWTDEAGARIAPVSHRVTIRHRDDVRQSMRFVHRGRILVIRTVRDPDERRRYLVCDCEEQVR